MDPTVCIVMCCSLLYHVMVCVYHIICMLYCYTTTGLASTSVFGCLWLSLSVVLVILVHDSWVNRLVYILRENSDCTEESTGYWVIRRGISLFIRISKYRHKQQECLVEKNGGGRVGPPNKGNKKSRSERVPGIPYNGPGKGGHKNSNGRGNGGRGDRNECERGKGFKGGNGLYEDAERFLPSEVLSKFTNLSPNAAPYTTSSEHSARFSSSSRWTMRAK